MNDCVLKYISEEKEISKYKLSLLSKGARRQYKARLVSIEREFLDFSFEKIPADSIDEMREAMRLFRSDRHAFHDKYEHRPAVSKRVITQDHVNLLKRMVLFYEGKYKSILDMELKKINLIQNTYVQGLLGKKDIDIGSLGIDSILTAEGAAVSKSRARIQILLYCLARFIRDKTKTIEAKVIENLSPDEFDNIKKELEILFLDLPKMLFKYYNVAIEEVPLLTNGSLGHNNFILATYPLSNLLDKYSDPLFMKRLLSKDKRFFSSSGSYIKKKFVDRGFGIQTPMRRIGNESTELLFADVWSSSGVRLTNILESEFFNYKHGDLYFKAISAKPIGQWEALSDNPYLQRELVRLAGLDAPLAGSIDITNKDVALKINRCGENQIAIDGNSSKILVAATRSELSHINVAKEYVLKEAGAIAKEFSKKFAD